MPWFIPYNRLDLDQREFVDDDVNQKLFISGFAGTGKSVVLVHKLIKIFNENPDAKCCIISFTHSLLEMFKLGIEESGVLIGRVSNQINSCCATNGQIDLVTKYEFRKNIQKANPIRYDFIMIDEVQDLCKSDIENAVNSGTEQIYLGGDDNQSIFTKDPQDDEPTITAEQRNELTQTVNSSLVRLYRVTPSILEIAKRIMPELHERLNGTQFGHTKDADVILASAEDERDEVQYVFENALAYAEDIELTAILLPKQLWIKDFCRHILEINNVELTPDILHYIESRNYTELNKIFFENGIRLEYVGNSFGSFRNAKENHNVVLMTYHSAKGMDFDNVFIPFLSSSRHERFSFFIPKPLMVAITRSNLNLTLSYSGESMAFVDTIRDACVEIDIDSDNDSDFLDY